MSASAAFEPLLWMLLFGVVASVPALIVAKMIAPRRRFWNPVKYMPMECGQVPSGEGRTRFMMQYYSYVLMFVAFDVILIFLYAWGVSLSALPRSVTLPVLVFLAIIGAAMSYAMYLSSRRDIW